MEQWMIIEPLAIRWYFDLFWWNTNNPGDDKHKPTHWQVQLQPQQMQLTVTWGYMFHQVNHISVRQEYGSNQAWSTWKILFSHKQTHFEAQRLMVSQNCEWLLNGKMMVIWKYYDWKCFGVCKVRRCIAGAAVGLDWSWLTLQPVLWRNP